MIDDVTGYMILLIYALFDGFSLARINGGYPWCSVLTFCGEGAPAGDFCGKGAPFGDYRCEGAPVGNFLFVGAVMKFVMWFSHLSA